MLPQRERDLLFRLTLSLHGIPSLLPKMQDAQKSCIPHGPILLGSKSPSCQYTIDARSAVFDNPYLHSKRVPPLGTNTMARKFRRNASHSLLTLFHFDARSLAVFRIAIATLVLLDIVNRAGDLSAFYTDEGVLPRHVLHDLTPRWQPSLHGFSGSFSYELALFAITGVLAVGMLLGFYTTLSTALCWGLITSLAARNPVILNGGDTYLRMLLFWSIFLPLADTWSVDAWRRCKQSKVHTFIAASIKTPQARVTTSLGCIALAIQVMLIYLTAGIPKAWVDSWQVGDAVKISLSMKELVTPFGSFLLNFPRLLWLLSYATLALEIIGPIVLVFSGGWGRLFTIGLFVIFHLGLAMCFSIGLFPFVCIAAFIPFIPSWVWSRFLVSATPSSMPVSSWRSTCAQQTKKRWAVHFFNRIGGVTSVAITLMALLITAWSCLGSINKSYKTPPVLHSIGHVFKWNQTWQMFVSLKGEKPQGWYVVHGQLRNGQAINLLTGDGLISYDQPNRVAATYSNFRWRKVYSRVRKPRYRQMRTTLGEYHRRMWNASHTPSEKIERLRISYVQYKKHNSNDNPSKAVVNVFGNRYPTDRPVHVTQIYDWQDSSIALEDNLTSLDDN